MNKLKTIILLFLIVALMLTSCNNTIINDTIHQPEIKASKNEIGKTGIKVYTELIKVDLEYGSEKLGFPINFVSDHQFDSDEVKLIRFVGKNVDYFDNITLALRQIQDVTDVKIDGQYLYSYNVESTIDIDYFTENINKQKPKIWEIEIDSIIFEISGEEYQIDLVYPVKYHYNNNAYNDIEGNHMYGPIAVMTAGLSNTYFANIHNYANKICFKDFYFSDFLDVKIKYLSYNGECIDENSIKSPFWIEKKNDADLANATVYYVPSVYPSFSHTDFDYILCTSILEYVIEGDNTVYKMRFPFNSQGIGNRETAEKFLAYISNK